MLNITLIDNKNTILLTSENGIKVSGIDGLYPPNASISTYSQAGIPGGIYKGKTIDTRNIVITLSLEYRPAEARKKIYQVCQPGKEITVQIDDITNDKTYKTDGYVETMEADYNALPVEMQISIICLNPYLTASVPSVFNSATVEGSFQFPFHTDNGENFIFGEKGSVITAKTENNGTVEAEAVFKIRAIEDTVNPSIWIRSTGEFFKINKTISKGEVVTINTSKTNRKVYINGISAIRYKDMESSWLTVPAGKEEFILTSDNNANANLEVSFYESYIGV